MAIRKQAKTFFPLGATPIEELSGLKFKNVLTQEELFSLEFNTSTEVTVQYLEGRKRVRKWTRATLFKIHREMFGKIWAWAGKKRTSDLTLGVKTFQIEEQIQQLLDDFKLWESQKMDPLEVATRLHHRLVQIHPFTNGNGRWARLVANIYFYQKRGAVFHWPEVNMRRESEFRRRYLQALKEADKLNYAPFLQLHQELVTPTG